MYGFLLEEIADAIRRKFGTKAWETIHKTASICGTFENKKSYSETVVPRIIKTAAEVTKKTPSEY